MKPNLASDRAQEPSGRSLLAAVAEAMRILLEPGDYAGAMWRAMGIIGEAASVDRVYVFENHESPADGALAMSQRFEWTRPGVSCQIDNPLLQELAYAPNYVRWQDSLERGDPVVGVVNQFPMCEQEILIAQDILAIAVVPIAVDGLLWGLVGFDDCHAERKWSESELEILQAAAAGIGASIGRQKSEQALREANESLLRQAQELRNSRRVALSLIEDARRAEQKAAAANQAKSAFLAVMSHEIRTPLNGMLGFADLILQEHPPPPVYGYAETIRTSGEILLNLISDILDLSKIESGNVEIQPQPCDPVDLVRQVVASLQQMAEAKELSLGFQAESSVPKAVEIDALRVRQVLTNLIGNALKFTSYGGVKVRLWAAPLSDDENVLILSCAVTDTGIGISLSELDRIFEPFSQANASVHRRFGGTGLGLAICRKLCQLMGGDVKVESVPGEGATFTFSLQTLAIDSTRLRPETKRPLEIPPLSLDTPLRVLIVDDVSTNRDLLCGIVRRMGCVADTAVDGEQAVDKVRAAAYDVIFMDVLMPGIDGCEATRRIRGVEAELARLPLSRIVALSADAMPENRERCFAAGMDGFLTKPLRISAISDALGRAVILA